MTRLDRPTIERLAARLSPEERRIILNQGTEPAFCGNLLDNHLDGTYTCRLCGLPLFQSTAKFVSGTGWPSFFQPVEPQNIEERSDHTYGMVRTEIRCARCGAHLGHVFPDGPRPTGLRYCVNSASLEFTEEGHQLPDLIGGLREETPSPGR